MKALKKRETNDVDFKLQNRGFNNEVPKIAVGENPLEFYTRPLPKIKSKKVINPEYIDNNVIKSSAISLSKIPSFPKFVSDYSRIQGVLYRDALKDPEVKRLYRENLSLDKNLYTQAKSSFEKRKIIDPMVDDKNRRFDKQYFTDPRLNKEVFTPTVIPSNEEVQKYSVGRNIGIELKRLYISYLRNDTDAINFFNRIYNNSMYLPLSSELSKTILDIAIKTNSKNILEISPMMECGILVSSFEKYQKMLNESNRVFTEAVIDTFQDEYVKRLGLDGTNYSNNTTGYDCLIYNLGSFINFPLELYKTINQKLLTEKVDNFSIFFSYHKKLENVGDMIRAFGFDVFKELVNGLTMSDAEMRELFEYIITPDKFKIQNAQDILNENVRISNILDSTAGDMRALLQEFQTANTQSGYVTPKQFKYVKPEDRDLEEKNNEDEDLLESLESKTQGEIKETKEDIEPPVVKAIPTRVIGDALRFGLEQTKIDELIENDLFMLAKKKQSANKVYVFEKYDATSEQLTYRDNGLLTSKKIPQNELLLKLEIREDGTYSKSFKDLEKSLPKDILDSLLSRYKSITPVKEQSTTEKLN